MRFCRIYGIIPFVILIKNILQQKNMSLIRKINYNKKFNKKCFNFTTPSHSQGDFVCPDAEKILGRKFYECDYSETEGFDNLRAPDGVLKELQQNISKIYTSKSSFILTNGSTSGIVAAMLAVLQQNDEVLIARNCHVSVYNGLVLTGARPVWFLPEKDEKWDIFKSVSPEIIEHHLKANPLIKAVIITSPTYEGIFSSIPQISEITKKYGAILIVDEAHGALCNFSRDYTGYAPAIVSGADISVHSLHKTAGAPNPCALLHIAKSSKVNPQDIQDALNLITTTSPSYPLMAAVEATVEFLFSRNGKAEIRKLYDMVEDFITKVSMLENVEVYSGFCDKSKILLRVAGIPALAVAKILNEDFKIEEEFSNDNSLLFLTGIGTSKKKFEALLQALREMSTMDIDADFLCEKTAIALPSMIYTPREAYFHPSEYIDTEKAAGRICSEVILPYPPGIPLILPGEMINDENIKFIMTEKVKVAGISRSSGQEIPEKPEKFI